MAVLATLLICLQFRSILSLVSTHIKPLDMKTFPIQSFLPSIPSKKFTTALNFQERNEKPKYLLPRQPLFRQHKFAASSLYQLGDENNDIQESPSVPVTEKWRTLKKVFVAMLSSLLIFKYRDSLVILAQTLDVSNMKSWMIGKLDDLSSLGTKGLLVYSFVFALWEIFVGITTPVETAAGMAFGVKQGIIASAFGKIGGAIIAFLIGKYALHDFVRRKLEGNEMMSLVENSIKNNPIGVALIWRFSFLPEFMKNFGLALLPLKTTHFMTAVFLHGFPFTCLWTCLGAEAGKLARGVVSTPSQTLKIMVGGVYILGFFVSPALVGAWIKSLQKKQQNMKKKST